MAKRDFQMLPYNRDLKSFARELRKNMTDAEKALWAGIRRKQLKGGQFYRQKIIGDYIVDFYCPAAKLVVELDGGQHYLEKGKERDGLRDKCLRGMGLRVLRFSNRDVLMHIDTVLERIYESL